MSESGETFPRSSLTSMRIGFHFVLAFIMSLVFMSLALKRGLNCLKYQNTSSFFREIGILISECNLNLNYSSRILEFSNSVPLMSEMKRFRNQRVQALLLHSYLFITSF